MRIDDALHRIRSYAESRGWSAADLAREAGVSWATVQGFRNLTWSPTTKTARKIEAIIPDDFEPDASAPFPNNAKSSGAEERAR